MQKAFLICVGLLALIYAASLGDAADPATEVCQSEDELWGGEDIHRFYFCLDGQVMSDECDPGTYFVDNSTVSGCVPSDMMNPTCVNLDVKVPDCTGANKMQPQAADEVTNFYLCTSEGPKELSCEDGHAFVDSDGYLGCFNWTQWRNLRNCNN